MTMLRLAPLALLLAGCTTATAQTGAAPARVSPGIAAPTERIPTDERRVTMIVRSIDNSLRSIGTCWGSRSTMIAK